MPRILLFAVMFLALAFAHFIAMSASRFARSWKIQPLRRAPQSLKIVILPRPLAEDVHHKISVVEQKPFRADLPFAVRNTHSLRVEPLFDRLADRLDLRLALPRAQQKI